MSDSTKPEGRPEHDRIGFNLDTAETISLPGSVEPPVSVDTVSGPILKHVPLHLISVVRNPRHTVTECSTAIGPQGNDKRASPPLKSRRTLFAVRRGAKDAEDANPGATGGSGSPGRSESSSIELDGLARSLGRGAEPRLVEPPVVEEMPDGSYRLCAGERRVNAALLAGWTNILCLVYPPLDPARAHTLSLLENIHRAPMHPLEEISALSISRLLANADARGIGAEARILLEDAWERSSSSYIIMRGLESLLLESGWLRDRPDVSWQAHLDDLGISMAPWERKRKLRMLNIDPGLQEQLRELEITEAALRSLGTLDPEEQRKVVDAVLENPLLARKIRRIARARRDGFYTSIDDALAEVQGLSRPRPADANTTGEYGQYMQYGPDEYGDQYAPDATATGHGVRTQDRDAASVDSSTNLELRNSSATLTQTPSTSVSTEIQDAVLQLLECADRLSSAIISLKSHGVYGTPGGVQGDGIHDETPRTSGIARIASALPEPWGTWSRDALAYMEGVLLDGNSN